MWRWLAEHVVPDSALRYTRLTRDRMTTARALQIGHDVYRRLAEALQRELTAWQR